MTEKIVTIPGDMPFDIMLRALAKIGLPNFVARAIAVNLKEDYRLRAPKAYICSPLGAPTYVGIHRNMLAARAYIRAAELNCGVVGVAPHAFLPEILSDSNTAERQMALNFGLIAVSKCQYLYVCGNRITEGMSGEIARAAHLNIPSVVFNATLLPQVQKIYRLRKKLVSLGTTGELALPPEIIWMSGEPEYVTNGAEDLHG